MIVVCRCILLLSLVFPLCIWAEFSPSRAHEVFDMADESVKSNTFESSGYVFIPVDWYLSGDFVKDRKAELKAVQRTFLEYLARTANGKTIGSDCSFSKIKSVVVRTYIQKRQRNQVIAYDAKQIHDLKLRYIENAQQEIADGSNSSELSASSDLSTAVRKTDNDGAYGGFLCVGCLLLCGIIGGAVVFKIKRR